MNGRNEFTPLQIAQAGRSITAPFGLLLHSANLGELEVDTVLRLLPGKRLTALARWHGKRVVVKLFVDPLRWQHHWQEEMTGHEALVEAHIPTPKLLNSEQHADESWAIVVYDYITPAESGERYWTQLSLSNDDTSRRRQLAFLDAIARVTATLHKHHLIQWDNHLDNFLVKQERVIVIDSGGVTRQNRLSPAQASTNLALLAAQFASLDDAQLQTLQAAYEETRGHESVAISSTTLRREIQRQRRLRVQNYLEKCQRECTDIAITHPRAGHFMAIRRSLLGDDLLQWATAPDERVEASTCLKNGNSQTVVTTSLDGRDVVIKRYNIKNMTHWIRRLGRTSRARKAWIAAHGLHLLKVATPQPVAMLETAVGPLHGPAYFIAERCSGVTLDIALREHPEWLAGLQRQMLRLCHTLLSHRISHGDFKASNFMVDEGNLWLIDLDAVQFHHSDVRFAKAFRKDLERFLRNWDGQPDIYNAFHETLAPILHSLDTLTRTPA